MEQEIFNIVTPCFNRGNLKHIYESLKVSHEFPVMWYIIYNYDSGVFDKDLDKEPWIHQYEYRKENGIAGYPQMNFALDLIKEGYIYHLSDLNILHPLFFSTLEKYIRLFHKKGYIFYQRLPNQKIRKNCPTNVTEHNIDRAQFLLSRELIGSLRYKNSQLGDGKFIETLFNNNRSDFTFITKELCYYNYLDYLRED